jgi:hypothetical protein
VFCLVVCIDTFGMYTTRVLLFVSVHLEYIQLVFGCSHENVFRQECINKSSNIINISGLLLFAKILETQI